MTFKHKLSHRLALLRDILLAGTVAFAACKLESRASLDATASKVIVSPETLVVASNQTAEFVAVALTLAGDTATSGITWTASAGSVTDMTTGGQVHRGQYRAPSSPGQYKVKARANSGSAADSATVTVTTVAVSSVTVSPATAAIWIGGAQQFTATAMDSAGNPLTGRLITWSSTNPAVATVSIGGLARGVSAGSATISATSEGQTATATVTVSPVPVAAVTISPSSATIIIGSSAQLTAITQDSAGNPLAGRVVTWTSSNTAVATVSGSGLVSAVGIGSATVTATSESKSSTAAITVTNVPVASVTVSPTSSSIAVGGTQQLSAVTKDAAGNTLTGRVVTWASSNTAVATVNGSGLVTGRAAGTATITATSEGKSGTAAITVTVVPVASVTVSPASATIAVGGTQQLSAVTKDSAGNTLTGRVVTWGSSNTAVATVSAAGLVRGVAAGSVTITATSEGKSGTAAITAIVVPVASVTVSPATASIAVGGTRQLTAAPKDSAGNTLTGRVVTWASDNTAVATVDANGLVSGVAAGSANITATSEGKSGSAAIAVTSGGTGAPDPTLPTLLNTAYSPPTGATINVPAGGNFQTALNNAQPGDQIVLAAGATYTGSFVLPVKSGTGWIIIRTSTPDAQLPAEGQRMKPTYAALLPKIVSSTSDPAISTDPGAHNYRFIAVEITTSSNLNYGLVLLGDGSPAQNTMAEVPHDLILDRTYIHGNATGNLSRCVGLNSAASAVIDSYLSECHTKGADAQAIAGWNGPGPFKLVNNYLEGSGENVMFGGADPGIPNLIPSDIEIRRNYFYKPLAWRGVWTAKNLLELKLGQRVLIQGNIFENSWADAQTGFALVFWSANETGPTTWAHTGDVWVRENIIRHVGAGLQLTDKGDFPAIPVSRVRFDNNLWLDVSTTWSSQFGRLFQVASNTNQLSAIKFYHQTGWADNTMITVASGATQQFEFVDNISAHGNFGIKSDDAGDGIPTLNLHMPGWRFAGNVVISAPSASYPTGNSYPSAIGGVGFVNAAGGDYSLAASSAYKGKATDGTDPGADFTALLFWTNGVDQ
jgi:uncharacterized protein YjdB